MLLLIILLPLATALPVYQSSTIYMNETKYAIIPEGNVLFVSERYLNMCSYFHWYIGNTALQESPLYKYSYQSTICSSNNETSRYINSNKLSINVRAWDHWCAILVTFKDKNYQIIQSVLVTTLNKNKDSILTPFSKYSQYQNLYKKLPSNGLLYHDEL